MGQVVAVLAGPIAMTRLAVALAIVLSAGTAHADDAKKLFEQGIAKYKEGDFPGAASLLSESYEKSPKSTTLFAWAQAEKNANNCDDAVPLFEKLLADDSMSKANKKAIDVLVQECREEIASRPPPEPEPEPQPPQEPEPTPRPPPPPLDDGPPAWYADPIGASLVGVGAVGIGVGVGFFVSALSKDSRADDAATQGEFRELKDNAESHQTIAIISSAVGVVALGAGITYYVLRRDSSDSSVSVWMDGESTGIGWSGRF